MTDIQRELEADFRPAPLEAALDTIAALRDLNADLLYACEQALAYLDAHYRGDDLMIATLLQRTIAKAKP